MKTSDIKPHECDAYTYEYIKLVPEGEFFQLFSESTRNVVAFFKVIPRDLHDYRYAEGKWTIKDVMQHMIDVERVFAYRILRFGRGDDSELPGFDVDDYAANACTVKRSMLDLLDEFEVLRKSTAILLSTLDPSHLKKGGIASQHNITVRAMAFKFIGHDLHHCYMVTKHYLKKQ